MNFALKKKKAFVNLFAKEKADNNVTIKLMENATNKHTKHASTNGKEIIAKKDQNLNVEKILNV